MHRRMEYKKYATNMVIGSYGSYIYIYTLDIWNVARAYDVSGSDAKRKNISCRDYQWNFFLTEAIGGISFY